MGAGEVSGVVAANCAAMFGVIATVIVVFPALVAFAQDKRPDFYSGVVVARRMGRVITALQVAIAALGAGMILGLAGVVWDQVIIAGISLGLLFIAMCCLTTTMLVVAHHARDSFVRD